MGLLSLAIWTPIAFGVILLALGRDDQPGMVRWVALIGSIISLLVTLPSNAPPGRMRLQETVHGDLIDF